MGTKVFVGNLSFDTTESALRTHFEGAGVKVDDVAIIMDRETGRPRGFGFVQLASADDAATAMSKLDGQSLDGRELRINEANERPQRNGGGGGGGRRY
jgi:RNA recognition motif-containing protein